MEKARNLPTIRDVNLLYLIPMALFFIVDQIAPKIRMADVSYVNKMLLISLLEILFVLLPIAIFIYLKKWDVGHLLRLNKTSLDNIALSVVIMLFAIPVSTFINAIVVFMLYLFGKVQAQSMFPSENLMQLILTLLVVAVTPAVVEEILCRGVLLRGYEKWGIAGSLLMSSLLFALLHRNIQSLVGTFLLGLLIAYIVYRTNSIFAGMVAHFINNGFIVVMSFFGIMLSKKYGNVVSASGKIEQYNGLKNLNLINSKELAMALVFITLFVLICAVILFGFLWLLKYNTRNINREIIEISEEKKENGGLILLYISFALVLFKYLQQLGVVELIKKAI